MASVDLELVRHAIRVARKRGYAEVEIGNEGWQFHAVLEPGVKLPVAQLKEEPVVQPAAAAIRAPLVGYYKANDPPLKSGQDIKKGDLVGGILALGIPNDVEAEISGVIDEVLVRDGEAVEFGQALATLRGA